jgi:uncharacterized protein YbjQ (UPF0145 family)
MDSAEGMRSALRRGETWDSALSVGEFAAVKSVGFEPVGQVFGAAGYYLATVTGVGCPGTTAAGYQLRDTSVSGQAVAGPAGRLATSLYEGRRTALDRMAGQCAELGGHGIVGAALQVSEIPATTLTAAAIEFSVTGTAVRGVGCPPLTRPFASELSGSDFATIVTAGWVPAGIALGISVAGLHDELVTPSSGPWGTENAEVPAYTGLVGAARSAARHRLEQSVRGLGADGVVVSALTLRVSSDRCHAHAAATDHFAEAVVTGSAVVRIGGARTSGPLPGLAVMHLDSRRTAAQPAAPLADRRGRPVVAGPEAAFRVRPGV